MCPFNRIDPREEATPRSKASALHAVLSGSIEPREMSTEHMKHLVDLCFNCKQCQLECPAHVDIPHLVIEARAQYVAANGLNRADWVLSRAHSFGRLGSTIAPFTNWALKNSGIRWLLERAMGIARDRKLPPFARRTFLTQAERSHGDRRVLSRKPRPVDLLRRSLRELPRPRPGLGLHSRDGAPGRAGLRAADTARIGHGDDLGRRSRCGPRSGQSQSPAAGRARRPRVFDRLHRAGRRGRAVAGVSAADRPSRCSVGRRPGHQRRRLPQAIPHRRAARRRTASRSAPSKSATTLPAT